jgi:hypothetical protein
LSFCKPPVVYTLKNKELFLKPAIAQSVQDGHAARNKAAISKPPTAIPTTDPEVPVSISWQPKICFQPNALRSLFSPSESTLKGDWLWLQDRARKAFHKGKALCRRYQTDFWLFVLIVALYGNRKRFTIVFSLY